MVCAIGRVCVRACVMRALSMCANGWPRISRARFARLPILSRIHVHTLARTRFARNPKPNWCLRHLNRSEATLGGQPTRTRTPAQSRDELTSVQWGGGKPDGRSRRPVRPRPIGTSTHPLLRVRHRSLTCCSRPAPFWLVALLILLPRSSGCSLCSWF